MNKTLIFVTGNQMKFESAQKEVAPYGIDLVHKKFDLDEIQSDSFEVIALHKAKQTFALERKAAVINDSGWHIPALNGFPGPYMKYIHQWFDAQDWIDLMQHHDNREVILIETITYIDDNQIKTFREEYKGVIVYEPKGTGGNSCDQVFVLNPNGKTIAEEKEEHHRHSEFGGQVWQTFAQWYSNK